MITPTATNTTVRTPTTSTFVSDQPVLLEIVWFGNDVIHLRLTDLRIRLLLGEKKKIY
jgi:hypothetical protein